MFFFRVMQLRALHCEEVKIYVIIRSIIADSRILIFIQETCEYQKGSSKGIIIPKRVLDKLGMKNEAVAIIIDNSINKCSNYASGRIGGISNGVTSLEKVCRSSRMTLNKEYIKTPICQF